MSEDCGHNEHKDYNGSVMKMFSGEDMTKYYMEDDEDHCVVCGNLLPKNPKPDSPQAQGYCCLHCMRSDENNWIYDTEN